MRDFLSGSLGGTPVILYSHVWPIGGGKGRCLRGTIQDSLRTVLTMSHEKQTGHNLILINPFFIAKNLQDSISFYLERLGFKLDFQGPEGDVYYARVSRDGIGIMLKAIAPEILPQPNHTRHPWARWDAFIYAENPDALYEEFRVKGVSFVKELSFIDDGLWGIEIKDADGYVLAFACTRNQ